MKKLSINILSALFCLFACISSAAELKNNHPEFHIVQPGDTLWDISELFLSSPWLWPEIWHVNDQVDNPHLIFPGDIISLVYIDGKPRITKTNRLPNGTIKLNPKARELTGDSAIATIPLNAIQPFLSSAQIVSEKELEDAPYVVGSDSGRLLAAHHNKIYVRGIQDKEVSGYSFFRKGQAYFDPETNELLGIEAEYIGSGKVVEGGDPAVLHLGSSTIELRSGDRAWPTNDEQLRPTYFPRAPENFSGGQIISIYGGGTRTRIGQYDVVVINKGARNQLEVGHVLSIFQRGKTIVDKIATKRNREDDSRSTFTKVKETFSGGTKTVTLPDEFAGRLMVFRTFEKVSLCLILKAEKPMNVHDKVLTPR